VYQLLKDIYPYCRPYKTKIIIGALCAIPLALVKVAQTSILQPLFDDVFKHGADLDSALMLAGLLLGLQVLNYPIRFFHTYLMRRAMDQVTSLIRYELVEKVQKIPLSYFNKNKKGNLVSIIMHDTIMFAESIRHAVAIIREPLTAIGFIGLALYHDWVLTCIILVVAPIFLFVFQWTGKKVRHYVTFVQQDFAEMTHNITEGVEGQKIIKALNLKKFFQSRFEKSQEKYLDSQRSTSLVEENSHPAVELVGGIAFALVIIIAYYRIQEGVLTTGSFMTFIGALAMFIDPMRKFSQANVRMNHGIVAKNRIFSILDEPIEEDKGTRSVFEFKDEIRLDDLTFSYGDQAPVLKSFNLSIKKGEKVALVGLSGSGKSTLINLLLKLYPVEQGSIAIDGVPLNELKLDELRDLFALVSQDVFLFNDTIENNILAGQNSGDEDLYEKSLSVSYSEDFVNNLEQADQTLIGDRGVLLSGGQAQRITIARAFMKNAPILLLDEATSALDNESEKIVQKALDRIGGEKTVIAVAHRLSTIQNFDKIVVMKEGQIVEIGDHQSLLEKDGEYKKLYVLSSS
jgi:subfamily B ATP-binding cassette protein MsbA